MRGARAVGNMLLAAVCLAGAGCSDSKGISKADYLAKAKEVCQQGNQQLTAASDEVFAKLPPGQKLSTPEIEDFVRKTVVPTIRDQVRQLRALEAPKGERGHVEEIYSALDRGLDELEKAPSKLTDGGNVFADADKLAQKYGIRVCATTG